MKRDRIFALSGRLWASIIVGLLFCLFHGSDSAVAQWTEAADGTSAGNELLEDVGDLSWYDAEQDALRPIELPDTPDLRQSSDWVWQTPQTQRRSSFDWETFWRVLQYLVWIVLLGTFIFLLYLWLNSLAQHHFAAHREEMEQEEAARFEADRIEQLPFHVKRPTVDLLGEARRHYQTGNFSEAIIYLFSYQLVQLDRHHRIELSKGKTNRQYLHEIRRDRPLRELVSQTVLAFEDVFFGHYSLDRSRFEACWERLDEFDRLASKGAAHASTAS